MRLDEASSSTAAEGKSLSEEPKVATPPSQEKGEDEMPTVVDEALQGLCLLWSRVVDSVVATHASALEPSTNYLAEIEAELYVFVVLNEDINLPALKDVEESVPVHQEDTRVLLEENIEDQLVAREQDIEDLEPLRSAVMTSVAGTNNQAADDNMSLLDDDLLDAQHAALQLESHRRLGVYMEVIPSTN